MTLNEYEFYLRVYQLNELDKQRDRFYEAVLARSLKATNKKGNKYLVTKESDLYDVDKLETDIMFPDNKVIGGTPKETMLARAERMAQFYAERENHDEDGGGE